jgi:small ligand-binding sensory domain FIST
VSGQHGIQLDADGPTEPAQRRFGDGLALADPQGGADALVRAAEDAVEQALRPLHGSAPDLLCVLVAPGPGDPEAAATAGRRAMRMAGARAAFGATAGGVIGDGRGEEDGPAVAAWAAVLPGARVRTFRMSAVDLAGEDAAMVAGLPTPSADDRVAALLVDPYSFPIAGFLDRCNTTMPGFPLVGGLASAPGGPAANRLFADGEVLEGGAVGVLLGGEVAARTVVSQGCRPIGPPMAVTRADGNLLRELAGAPAYRRLVEIVSALPAAEQGLVARGLHLGVAIDEYADEHGRGDFLIRGVLGADERSGVVAVGDVVEVGRTVRFQVRDPVGAREDLIELLGGTDRPGRGALLFSCNGRGRAMFPRPDYPGADHDVQIVREALGADGVAGLFAAGEIGPVGGRNHLHGFTASVLIFR